MLFDNRTEVEFQVTTVSRADPILSLEAAAARATK